MAAHLNEAQKQTKYLKIFYALLGLTALELAFLFLPLPHLIISILVVVSSASKAVVVGYYYMHLEYETRWLKMVVCLPCICFGYAFFLSVDAHMRPMSNYYFAKDHSHHSHEVEVDEYHVNEEAVKAEAWLKASSEAQAKEAKAEPAEAAQPQAGDRPQGAPPLVEGVDQWR